MNTKDNIVEEKIELLHDFRVLLSNATKQEATIRNVLTLCPSYIRMEHKLHNILYGNETVKDFIKREEIKMQKFVFTTNGFERPHIGYTLGDNWNGWATPYFEVDEALAIMKEFNTYELDNPFKYDEETDTFVLKMEDGEIETWRGRNYLTEEGVKHLYGIGAYAWTWEEVTQADIYAVAQRIEDFLWEFDTYEHRNQYNSREELVEKIVKQLQDFKTLKYVLKVLYTWDLTDYTEEEIYNALGKELKV